jgi:hypothetical protein
MKHKQKKHNEEKNLEKEVNALLNENALLILLFVLLLVLLNRQLLTKSSETKEN